MRHGACRSRGFFFLSLLCTAVAGCHRADAPPPAPVPAVLTMTVHARPAPALTRRGAVAAGSRLRLGFNAAGVLATVKVKSGDRIRKGQLLAQLKDGGASASLWAAQANRSRALRDYGAAKALAETGSVAPVQQDDARSALQVASANTSLAAELLSQRQIFSPIVGTVVLRLAEPGEAVGPGMPVLVIDETERLAVKLGVTERELARVAVDQPAMLVVDGSPTPVPALVSSIGPAPLDDGLYPVEVSPQERTAVLRPGTLLTVRFEERTPESLVVVPLDALVHRDGKTCAFVVDGSNTETRAHLHDLDVARIDDKDVIVRSGLRDGERIVREGAEFIEDGQPVRRLD